MSAHWPLKTPIDHAIESWEREVQLFSQQDEMLRVQGLRSGARQLIAFLKQCQRRADDGIARAEATLFSLGLNQETQSVEEEFAAADARDEQWARALELWTANGPDLGRGAEVRDLVRHEVSEMLEKYNAERQMAH